MLHTHAVPKMDTVHIAGATAIGVILPLGEKSREDAVLHVKHRHVLVDRQLEPFGRSRFEQIEYLNHIQIVAEGQTPQSMPHEELCSQGVCNIQRKVTDRREAASGKMGDGAEITEQDTVWTGIPDQLEESLLGCFLDPGCRQENAGIP